MAVTRNINDDNTLSYLFRKNNQKADGIKGELDAFKAEFLNSVYPVGSIYMSVNSASPETLFGGRWERITGRFLLAATDDGANGGNSNANVKPGYTGGEAAHQLTTGELASHNHFGILAFAGYSGWPTQTFTYADNGYIFNWNLADIIVNKNAANYTGHLTARTQHRSQNTGSNIAHNTMPPYLAVYVWKRTA